MANSAATLAREARELAWQSDFEGARGALGLLAVHPRARRYRAEIAALGAWCDVATGQAGCDLDRLRAAYATAETVDGALLAGACLTTFTDDGAGAGRLAASAWRAGDAELAAGLEGLMLIHSVLDRAGTGELARLADLAAHPALHPIDAVQKRAFHALASALVDDRRAASLAKRSVATEWSPVTRQLALRAEAYAHLLRGRVDEAVSTSRAAIAVAPELADAHVCRVAALVACEAGVPDAGDLDGVEQLHERDWSQDGMRGFRALARGDAETARIHFTHARSDADRGARFLYRFEARYGLALARIACGERALARGELRTLAAECRLRGFPPLALLCERALRRIAQPPRPSPPLRLTAREADALELAAGGATSAQIARTLGVSSTTVDTLLGRARSRLAAGNRRQAVAILAASEPRAPRRIALDRPTAALIAGLEAGATIPRAAAGAHMSTRTAHRRLAALRAQTGTLTTTQLVGWLLAHGSQRVAQIQDTMAGAGL